MLRVKSWKFDDARIFEHTLFGFSDLLHHRCQWIVWWVGNMINNKQTNEMENLSQSKIIQTNRRRRMIRAVKKWKEKWPKSDFDFYENPLVVAEYFFHHYFDKILGENDASSEKNCPCAALVVFGVFPKFLFLRDEDELPSVYFDVIQCLFHST